MATDAPIQRLAYVSNDGLFRYTLGRTWGHEPIQHWIMLNPSTADHTIDDPTIRKCMEFSRRSGHGGIWVTNLFAYRATSPKEMLAADNPIGPDNHQVLVAALRDARASGTKVIAAWGEHGQHTSMRQYVQNTARCLHMPLWCLSKNLSGAPKHPLYIPYSATPHIWDFVVEFAPVKLVLPPAHYD